jgi:hypothetical protein
LAKLTVTEFIQHYKSTNAIWINAINLEKM